MEKHLLRPQQLSLDPEAADAERVFTFWLRTVQDFIEGLGEIRRDGDPAVNSKRIIIGCLSPAVHPVVEDAATYDDIVQILKDVYVKKKNNVYSRHLLVSRQQLPSETISDFLQALKALAKECSFAEVTASVYREKMTRDAFINGLSSAAIRQRLLEKDKLTLVQAFELADCLDRAKRQALSMGQPSSVLPPSDATICVSRNFKSNSSTNETKSTSSLPPYQLPSPTTSKSCFFCGGKIHVSRKLCPARDAICHGCNKPDIFRASADLKQQ